MWNLDWSVHKTVTKGENIVEAINKWVTNTEVNSIESELPLDTNDDVHEYISKSIQHLSDKRKSQLNMPGYPK